MESFPFQLTGIHHVTAMASDPQANINFYEGVLGLRLVKVTVNYDDPSMVHTYFGNAAAEIGSTITFFPIPGLPRGRSGRGAAHSLTYSVPSGTLPAWQVYLATHSVAAHMLANGDLAFTDPDGLNLRLRESVSSVTLYEGGSRPRELALQRIVEIELDSFKPDETQRFLERMGGRLSDGAAVTLVERDEIVNHHPGAGTFHHVAFTSSASIEATHAAVEESGRHISPILNRDYFRSIYFREPGAVLFEVATPDPGFGFDEPMDALGTSIRIPEWLGTNRDLVRKNLPKLHHWDGNVISLS